MGKLMLRIREKIQPFLSIIGWKLLGRTRSTQVGIELSAEFSPDEWVVGRPLPIIHNEVKSNATFLPTKLILSELITVTFNNKEKGPTIRATTLPDCGDIVVCQAFVGQWNCFHNAPKPSYGISGCAFANDSYGNGLLWPTVREGDDISLGISIEKTALYRIQPPDGYTIDDIEKIEIKARANLFGPIIRD